MDLQPIYDRLKADLVAVRRLPEQVVSEITDRHNVTPEDLPAFFDTTFPTLEDYQVDLILSPVYTPTQDNKLSFASLLREAFISTEQVSEWTKQLESEALVATLQAPNGLEIKLPLHEVSIDRYVRLLGLDRPISADVHIAIEEDTPAEDYMRLNWLAREGVWSGSERGNMLVAFLKVFKVRKTYSAAKVEFLTDFLRTYRPSGLFDLARQFDSLIASCESDLEGLAGRAFHDPQLKGTYSDSELAHYQTDKVRQHYQSMITMAQELKEDYHQLAQIVPDYVASQKALQ